MNSAQSAPTAEQHLGIRQTPPKAKKKPGRKAKPAAPVAQRTFVLPPKVERTVFPDPTTIIPGIKWAVEKVRRKEEKGEGWHNFTLVLTLADRRSFRFAQEKETTPSMLHDAVLAMKVRLNAEAEAAAEKAEAKAKADSRRS